MLPPPSTGGLLWIFFLRNHLFLYRSKQSKCCGMFFHPHASLKRKHSKQLARHAHTNRPLCERKQIVSHPLLNKTCLIEISKPKNFWLPALTARPPSYPAQPFTPQPAPIPSIPLPSISASIATTQRIFISGECSIISVDIPFQN